MKLEIPQLSVADYARSLRADGARVLDKDGFWWREVRPFFFRPALPFQVPPAGARPPSWRAALGGFQHAVAEGETANSEMAFLIFRDADRYSLEDLKSGWRAKVRNAAKTFEVRPITDAREFSRLAHPVYVAFHRRTQYFYLANRLKRDQFEAWATSTLGGPGAVVLGAFSGAELVAVSVSRLVGDMLIYSTFFAYHDAMRNHVSSLMLHVVRQVAAERGGISSIFAGMRKFGEARSVDEFYLMRGASLERQPARLSINPTANLMLGVFRPEWLRQLRGEGI